MKAEATIPDNCPVEGARSRRRPRRLSEHFARLADEADGHLSIGDIRDALGTRSLASLLVLFAALNLLPLPPGTSAILGLPLIIISAQMACGVRHAWLPACIANRSLGADRFRAAMEWIIPRLKQVERLIRPRYWPFWRRRGERTIGVIALLLGIVVTLPIPLGNWLPAFATALLGLALSERDGILLAVAGAVSVLSLIVVAAVIGAAGFATSAAINWLF